MISLSSSCSHPSPGNHQPLFPASYFVFSFQYEARSRLQQLSGSNAISSADLFGESETGNSGMSANNLRDGFSSVTKGLVWPLTPITQKGMGSADLSVKSLSRLHI